MEFRIEGPAPIEVSDVQVDGGDTLVITPELLKGQHMLRVCYLTATGSGGAEAKAMVVFNANTGVFTLKRPTSENVTFAFDKPLKEFRRHREKQRQSGQKLRQFKTETENATADQELRGEQVVSPAIAGQLPGDPPPGNK